MKVTHQVGRNELCPCGSGKKFKKCCLVSPQPRVPSSQPHLGQTSHSLPVNRLLQSPPTSLVRSRRANEVLFDAPLANGGRLHAVLLYSDEGLSRTGIQCGEQLTLDLPDLQFRGPARVMAIQRTFTNRGSETKIVRVVQFRDAEDLGKVLYGKWSPPPEVVERWRSRRREVVLRMDFPDHSWCDIVLSRTTTWMDEHKVREGAKVFLDLEHVGVRGWANVLEINLCGPIKVGQGELVTGTFKFSHGHVGELVLESEPKPIGVTALHPFWSVDRQNWVPVSELLIGEQVKTSNGTTHVVSFTMTDRTEPVYNLEVAYSNCYHVGQSGVLVHNQSTGCPADRDTDALTASLGQSPYPVPGRAHHIFPVSEFKNDLCCWGVDLNSSDNGVWLPYCDYPNRTASVHRGTNNKDYIDDVVTALKRATNRADAIAILSDIKSQLLNGTLKVNKADESKPCS